MTLSSSLHEEAKKAALGYAEKVGFLAGVKWLFSHLTKAPEGFKSIYVHSRYDDIEGMGEFTSWPSGEQVPHYPESALASLRAENEVLKIDNAALEEIRQVGIKAYNKRGEEITKLSAKCAELEEMIKREVVPDIKDKEISNLIQKLTEVEMKLAEANELNHEFADKIKSLETELVRANKIRSEYNFNLGYDQGYADALEDVRPLVEALKYYASEAAFSNEDYDKANREGGFFPYDANSFDVIENDGGTKAKEALTHFAKLGGEK